MATAAPYWQRRPVFESMQYNGPEDLEDLRAWVATKSSEGSDIVVKRVEVSGDGFLFYVAWAWDQDNPETEWVGATGVETDWVVDHFGSLLIYGNDQFTREYEPVAVEPTP